MIYHKTSSLQRTFEETIVYPSVPGSRVSSRPVTEPHPSSRKLALDP